MSEQPVRTPLSRLLDRIDPRRRQEVSEMQRRMIARMAQQTKALHDQISAESPELLEMSYRELREWQRNLRKQRGAIKGESLSSLEERHRQASALFAALRRKQGKMETLYEAALKFEEKPVQIEQLRAIDTYLNSEYADYLRQYADPEAREAFHQELLARQAAIREQIAARRKELGPLISERARLVRLVLTRLQDERQHEDDGVASVSVAHLQGEKAELKERIEMLKQHTAELQAQIEDLQQQVAGHRAEERAFQQPFVKDVTLWRERMRELGQAVGEGFDGDAMLGGLLRKLKYEQRRQQEKPHDE